MRLNQNMQSLSAFKNYKQHIIKNSTALERVSTGSKINSAKDNPNKLGQSESIRMQIRGLQVAERNIQDGISMMQTADSAMGTINDALLRMRDLVVSSSEGTTTDKDREIIQNEINQLKGYIDQTAENTEFNGNKLLNTPGVIDNDYPSYKNMQAGANVDEDIRIPYFNVSTEVLGIADVDITITGNLDKAIVGVDKAISTINATRSKYGSIQQRMESTVENHQKTTINLEKADSNLRDADLALEMVEFSRTTILKDTATAIMTQTNNFPQEILRILEKVK